MTEQRMVDVELLECLETICTNFLTVAALQSLPVPATEKATSMLRSIIASPNVGWQPIETAPKDGTTIIAYRPTDPPHIEGMHWCNYDEGGAWHWSYDGDSPMEMQPTHWMPLPQPPKED